MSDAYDHLDSLLPATEQWMWPDISGELAERILREFDDDDWSALAAAWPSRSPWWQEAMADTLGDVGSTRAVDILCAMVLQTAQPHARILGIDGLRGVEGVKAALAGRDDVLLAVLEIDDGPRELGGLAAGALLALLR
jgi:hypothetical protein